jgi:hypothetical protein
VISGISADMKLGVAAFGGEQPLSTSTPDACAATGVTTETARTKGHFGEARQEVRSGRRNQ